VLEIKYEKNLLKNLIKYDKKPLIINYKNKNQPFYQKHGNKCGCKHPLFLNPAKAKGKNKKIYNLLLEEQDIRNKIKRIKKKLKQNKN